MPPEPKRWMPLTEARAMLAKVGFDVSERTLQRWCRAKRLPARRRLAWAVNADQTRRGGRFQWVLDLRELKAGSIEGRILYEELMAGD